MVCCSGASSSRVFFSSVPSSEAASVTRPDRAPGSVTKSRAASRSSFMRRSISSARSPTSCSRCSSANVESMWRMAMTLAMLVAVITASSVKKLPKVIWPIESENDRIRYKIDAKIADMTEKTGLKDPVYTTDFAPGNTRGASRRSGKISFQPGHGRISGKVRPGSRPPVTKASIGCNAGLFDHLGPQGDVGLDDIGKLREWRALGLAAGGVEFLPHVGRRQGHVQRLADALDDRLRRRRRQHHAEPGRHLRLGKALLRQGRHIGEIFGAAVIDGADDPDRAGLHLPQRLVGGQEGRGDQTRRN